MHFSGGLPETLCGGGSTMEATAHIREQIPALLHDLGVKSVLDAPCGDLNWMRHVSLKGIEYFGVDFDRWHIETAKLHQPNVMVGDIAEGVLPTVDLILSRDFLQHLPNATVWKVLRNFTGAAEWLLMTSHTNSQNDDIQRAGDFRPLNLQAAPFRLPAPQWQTDDPPGSSRILGLWSAHDIRQRLHP